MAAVSYIEKLLNNATRDLTSYKLIIEYHDDSNPAWAKKITNNIFTDTIRTQEFERFIWELYSHGEKACIDLTDKEAAIQQLFRDEASTGEGLSHSSYNELFKAFEELCGK